jgi:diguanylate cyclase (GGDEF)-like protein
VAIYLYIQYRLALKGWANEWRNALRFGEHRGGGGESPLIRVLQWWWRRPTHFDWFSSYLRVRRMANMTRGVVAAASLSLAAIPVAMLWSSAPPRGITGILFTIASGVGATACVVLWVARFPSKNQSVAYAVLASASIAAAVLAQSDPLTGILACAAFATISGYIALFHAPSLMVTNLVFVIGVTAVPAAALASDGGVVRAACASAIVLVLNIAVPFGIQIIVQTLGVDLLKADRDPLTGLLNRRAFYQRTSSLVDASGSDAYVVLAMIDLDRFKRLNDTHGHYAGDVALVAVGRALHELTNRAAVVARAGGEEFLVAEVVSDPRPVFFGRRLCEAVAALPHPVTASVGTAVIQCDRMLEGGDNDAAITALISAADTSMYEAKRNGGNQFRHALLGTNVRMWNSSMLRWERVSASPRVHANPLRAIGRPNVVAAPDAGDATTPIIVGPSVHREHRRRHGDVRPETPRGGYVASPPNTHADQLSDRPGRHRAQGANPITEVRTTRRPV